MEESNADRTPKQYGRKLRWPAGTACYLRDWGAQYGRKVPGGFLKGAAYKLGSGAVTLLILWWETRH
ncbi:hypothetical protein [Streptomyces canus]|uniref:hypothetical protein n=1 Tax=Streptomyces canus TaxID=58343 RepID=UPI002E2D2C48|nr:hypothetical protein [Streptomyces canus]